MTPADDLRPPVPDVGHLSLAEAAQRLGCSTSFLYHHVPAGLLDALEPFKSVTGRWQIPAAAIARYEAERRRTAYGRPLPTKNGGRRVESQG